MITETILFHDSFLLTHFSKTTAPQQAVFSGKLSTNIFFKLCTFNVNLWTLCFFLSYIKCIDPLNTAGSEAFDKCYQV